MALKTILTTAALALCLSIPGMAQEQTARDSAERAQRQLDSLRVHSISLGTNLFYWGSSTPNAHFWIF